MTAPNTVVDSDPDNNEATDVNTLGAQVDLSVTKTDGVTATQPGQTLTYTIVVSNTGPATATGAILTDTFPAALQNVSFTSTAAGVQPATRPVAR